MTIDGVNVLTEYGFGVSRLISNMDFLKRKKQSIHSWDDENGEEYMVDQGEYFYEPKDIRATCFVHGASKSDFQGKIESVKTIFETPGLRTVCFDSNEEAHLVYAKDGATLSRMIKLNDNDNVAKFIIKLREPQPYNIQFKYDISGTLETASITLSVATGYTVDVHWGDGEITTGVTGADQVKPHTYPAKGVYYITIIGDLDQLTKIYIGGSVVQYIYGDGGKAVKKMSISATDLLLTGAKINRYSKSIIPATCVNLKLDGCAITSGNDIWQVLKDVINDSVSKLADRPTSMNIWLDGGTNAGLPVGGLADYYTIAAYLVTGSIKVRVDGTGSVGVTVVGSEAVTTAGTTITFSSELPSGDYAVFIRCFDAGGNNIDFMLTEKAASGFKITPAINGTVEYIAITYLDNGSKSRAGTESVIAAGTVVSFNELFSSAYKVLIRCFDAGGNNVDFLFTDKTTTGFKVTPVIDSTIEYIAVIGEITNIRTGSEAVTTAGTAVTFSSALPSTDYAVGIVCLDGSGNSIDFALTNKTVNGFTITPAVNGTIEYIAIINEYSV